MFIPIDFYWSKIAGKYEGAAMKGNKKGSAAAWMRYKRKNRKKPTHQRARV